MLSAARAHRAELYESLKDVERAAASPAPNREASWRRHVAGAVAELGAAFEDHIAVTEGSDGLLKEITNHAPRLSGPAARLEDEHASLKQDIKATKALASSGAPVDKIPSRERPCLHSAIRWIAPFTGLKPAGLDAGERSPWRKRRSLRALRNL
jgi:hypothetical protein